jgi:hypothetical protein
MRKISLVFAMIMLLASASVMAQKNNASPAPLIGPTPEPTWVCIQDDNGGGYFMFNLADGSFKCTLCEYNYDMDGVGQVKIDGCNVYFSVLNEKYRMFASLDMCSQQAKIAIEVGGLPSWGYATVTPEAQFREYWSDSNLGDSKPDCTKPVLGPKH